MSETSVTREAVDPPPLVARRRERTWVRRAMLFAAITLFANALFGEQGLADGVRARRQIRAASANLATLRAENAKLLEHARQLRVDPRAIEDAARGDLGLVRPGEILVVLK
jgi:cell division protein FtsB